MHDTFASILTSFLHSSSLIPITDTVGDFDALIKTHCRQPSFSASLNSISGDCYHINSILCGTAYCTSRVTSVLLPLATTRPARISAQLSIKNVSVSCVL